MVRVSGTQIVDLARTTLCLCCGFRDRAQLLAYMDGNKPRKRPWPLCQKNFEFWADQIMAARNVSVPREIKLAGNMTALTGLLACLLSV